MPTLAAVDIGANSVRLKIARVGGHRIEVIHEDRQVTRLGEQVFSTGLLSPDAMAETVKVLRRFHRAAQKFAVDTVRVVATSALRNARNRKSFVEWVYSSTGWQVEVISGTEEARLIHLGLVSNLRIISWPVLMVDLGGGSCELTISAQKHIRETFSVPLGAVRLTREFLAHDPPRKKELGRLRAFVDRELGRAAKRIINARVKAVIATSGTAAALAAVAANRYPTGGHQGGSFVSAATAARLVRMLSRRSLEQRASFQGIGPRRAEIIVAGAVVFAELLDRCRLRNFRYSTLGLRDGLLAQMAADYSRSAKSREQIAAERWESVLHCARQYGVELHHAMQVRDFALELFRKLQPIHGLPPEYRDWLSAAAMLYEVGTYINRNGRYRHAWYVISHSDILGYSPQQRRIIAAIARYLGTSVPLPSDAPMKAIPSGERRNATRACMLLRLARALNLGRRDAVRDVRVQLRNSKVVLSVAPKRGTDVELEVWALERERNYFREVFGRELSPAIA
jgi:exopolyphosphatase / guanosine-5'-triphosphate,3'-diphosphate pyrophosphatase